MEDGLYCTALFVWLMWEFNRTFGTIFERRKDV